MLSTERHTVAPAEASSSLISTGRLVLLPSGIRLSLPPMNTGNGERVASPDLIVGNFAQLEVDRLDSRDTALQLYLERFEKGIEPRRVAELPTLPARQIGIVVVEEERARRVGHIWSGRGVRQSARLPSS